MDYRRLLGAVVNTERCATAGMQIVNGSGWSEFNCPAVFERGSGAFSVKLVLGGGVWKLANFAVKL